MSNEKSPSGKVRPAWMGGPQGTPEKDPENARNGESAPPATAPEEAPPNPEESREEATEGATAEPATDPETDSPELREPHGPAREPVAELGPLAETYSRDHDHAAQDDPEDYPYEEPSSKEPAASGIGSAISAFARRLTGERNRVAEAPPQESPQEVERRLKLSLRETGVRDFCRVCFGSPKGGVGKSSLAYAVACALSDGTNLRVALVDADPNFGATRFLVPRPIRNSVLDLAEDADELQRLADLREYVSQNERMGLDVILNPVEAAQIAYVEDLADAYERIDSVLSRFYDLVIYDLGLGFRDPAIRRVLSLSDELIFVSDAEVIPNAQLSDALRYVEGLGVDLSRTTLAINHRLPTSHESAPTPEIRANHASCVRRVTEVPYDPAFSRSLNTRAFHIDQLDLPTRHGVLTTAGAALEGLRREGGAAAHKKVVSLAPSTDPGANIRRASAGRKGGM